MEIIKNTFDVNDGNSSWNQEEFAMIGHKYLCIETFKGDSASDIERGYDSIFTKGKRYELTNVDRLSATFRGNGDIGYFLKTYVKACLFRHFDFTTEYNNYIAKCRKEKIDSIIND